MIPAAIIYTLGCVCAWAICAASNHGAADHRFSLEEIVWIGVLWPFAALVWAVLSFIDWCEQGVSS